MADFRRYLPALAGALLLMGIVSTASAQTAAFQCVANAGVPPLLRAEGLTELTGDVVLNCTGGTVTAPGAPVPQANITIFLNTSVTSRLMTTPPGNSEALLLIDEPGTASNPGLRPCTTAPSCTISGDGAGNEFRTTAVNAFTGTVSGNSITWIGVPIEPPGTTGTRVYRFTNIRANASAVAPGASGTPGQVIALISATPATSGVTSSSVPINNPQQIIGFVSPGLKFSVDNSLAIKQCVSVTNGLVATLTYTENFATAFKTRTSAPFTDTETSPAPVPQNIPGLIYNAESGFYAPAAYPGAGLADFGTRLKATFNNLPAGVTLFISTISQPVPGASVARLVGTESGFFFPTPSSTTIAGQPAAAIPIVNGSTAIAVWEVLAAQPLSIDTFTFNVWATTTANPANNSPAIGQATVNGSFAPTPPVFPATTGATAQTASYPIPRFIDTSTATPVLNVLVCRTNLLFPFVSNKNGFDTGLAIANTSADPFGTSTQTGTCTWNFYGDSAPAAITSPTVAPGTVYAALASSVAPNFQGYIIAICNFQYAHGFAFISDLGARNLAMGYLALVIPDPARTADPFPSAGVGSGEQLGY